MRVTNIDGAGMQEKARQRILFAETPVNAPLAIGGVADDLMLDVREMTANLVSTTGRYGNAEERQAAKVSDFLERCQSGSGNTVIIAEGTINNLPGIRDTSNQCQVFLFGIFGSKGFLKSPGDFTRECKNYGTRGSSVQSVDREEMFPQLFPKLLK